MSDMMSGRSQSEGLPTRMFKICVERPHALGLCHIPLPCNGLGLCCIPFACYALGLCRVALACLGLDLCNSFRLLWCRSLPHPFASHGLGRCHALACLGLDLCHIPSACKETCRRLGWGESRSWGVGGGHAVWGERG